MIIENLGADAIVACSTDLLPGVAAVVKREEVGFVRLPYLRSGDQPSKGFAERLVSESPFSPQSPSSLVSRRGGAH